MLTLTIKNVHYADQGWGAGTKAGSDPKAGPGTSGTNGNVPGSASGSEERPKTGTDAETSVGITAPLVRLVHTI